MYRLKIRRPAEELADPAPFNADRLPLVNSHSHVSSSLTDIHLSDLVFLLLGHGRVGTPRLAW
jgi:hypothetical protein